MAWSLLSPEGEWVLVGALLDRPSPRPPQCQGVMKPRPVGEKAEADAEKVALAMQAEQASGPMLAFAWGVPLVR